jgi:hypothetical protein
LDLDIAAPEFFACTANSKELLDDFANDRVRPRGIADITMGVSQETELFKETVL